MIASPERQKKNKLTTPVLTPTTFSVLSESFLRKAKLNLLPFHFTVPRIAARLAKTAVLYIHTSCHSQLCVPLVLPRRFNSLD